MNDIENEKIDKHSDELAVESEEKQTGTKIEVDEDRLPSRAMAIHEHIRQEGEKEMERDAMALLWSAIAAGLSMGASLLAKGIFHVQLEGVEARRDLASRHHCDARDVDGLLHHDLGGLGYHFGQINHRCRIVRACQQVALHRLQAFCHLRLNDLLHLGREQCATGRH